MGTCSKFFVPTVILDVKISNACKMMRRFLKCSKQYGLSLVTLLPIWGIIAQLRVVQFFLFCWSLSWLCDYTCSKLFIMKNDIRGMPRRIRSANLKNGGGVLFDSRTNFLIAYTVVMVRTLANI